MRKALVILPLLSHLLVLPNRRRKGRDPWTTTLSMTRKAIAVGECSAGVDRSQGCVETGVASRTERRLRLDGGFRFECERAGGRAAVGKYDGATSFAVCACRSAGGNGRDGDRYVPKQVDCVQGARPRRVIHDLGVGTDRGGREQW